MAQNLGTLASVWWEQPKELRDGINKLRASIFGPHARKLTFEFGKDDSSELRELRSTVISAAAAGGDEWTIAQIKERFAPLRDAGDDSKIHPDLLRTVLSQSVRHGGEAESLHQTGGAPVRIFIVVGEHPQTSGRAPLEPGSASSARSWTPDKR